MKKLIISSAFIFIASITGYSQFSENGYKGLKLAMQLSEAQKVVNFKLDNGSAKVKYDDLDLDLTYYPNEGLFSIATKSPKAKLEGVSQNLIGKTLKEVKAILGNKLAESFYGDTYYMYYKNKAAQENERTSCVLIFNDDQVLEQIMASYNP